jgi:carbonic anhydrase/acetyltransferase-like protein (isoleucine patch superfamily)
MSVSQNIHPSAILMKGVVLEGDITIGENSYIGAGTVLVANGGKIEIGKNTVIMENAVIRSSRSFDCRIGDHVLVGPKASITGSQIADACFIATNGTIFHGSTLETGTVLAVNGIIHIDTHCPENTFIPINHIGFGKPAMVYSPAEIPDFHAELRKTGFVKYVYGIDTQGLSNPEVYQQMTEKFLSNLKETQS